MKQLPLSQVHQVFSSLLADRPNRVWVLDLESDCVSGEIVEQCTATSTGWAGWGFFISGSNMEYTTACLLFERKEDAVMAKLVYGDQLYAN
jgi:hypothetical protein